MKLLNGGINRGINENKKYLLFSNQLVISIIGILIPDYLFQEAQELVVGDVVRFWGATRAR